MKNSEKLPELLAPAGNFECLLAAVEAEADAVYVGGKRFGARAFAKNFDLEELSRAAVYCNLHGVKLYVTVNTLVDDKEFPELIEYAAELYRIGVSALIIADLGAIAEIRRCVPQLELHASTQMSVHNTDGAIAARELGVSRVVVARELPLSEKEINPTKGGKCYEDDWCTYKRRRRPRNERCRPLHCPQCGSYGDQSKGRYERL